MATYDTKLFKSLNPRLIHKFFDFKINTIYDFLQWSTHELSRGTGLSYKSIEDIKENQRAYCQLESAKSLDIHRPEIERISTGINNLDYLLEGGLEYGSIYEVCGSSSSGKSQLCHWISCYSTLYESTKVHYIDTCRSFSATAIQMILDGKQGSDKMFSIVMSGIKRHPIQDMRELFQLLDHLSAVFTHQENARTKRFIIIDSLPKLCRLIPLERYNLSLTNLACMIRYIVNHSLTAILIVNTKKEEYVGPMTLLQKIGQSYSFEPSLGDYWMYVPNVRLLLTYEENQRRKIAVWRSPKLEDGKSCLVDITDEGIFPVSAN